VMRGLLLYALTSICISLGNKMCVKSTRSLEIFNTVADTFMVVEIIVKHIHFHCYSSKSIALSVAARSLGFPMALLG
jgi:hypothetical protein